MTNTFAFPTNINENNDSMSETFFNEQINSVC